MSRQITIDPVTRIEGHARVEIDVDDHNHISCAAFKVMDFRGFEVFLQGMHVEMMPAITARICGTCPQTHHLAASRAVDKVFGVRIPRTARLLRNVINLGAMIHSHSVHFFALAGPDLLLGLTADPAERNIIGMAKAHPELSKDALRLRSIGQRIVELVGGRGTHPVTSVAGGMAAPLGREKGEKLKALVAEGGRLGFSLYETVKKLLMAQRPLLTSLPLETCYMGTVKEGTLDFYEGDLRLRRPDGTHMDISEDDWAAHFTEEAVDHSYAKNVFFRTDSETLSFRVGPLARLNCAERLATPRAEAELAEMRERFGDPCHETVLYHHARMIELIHALELLDRLTKEPDLYGDEVKGELGGIRNAAAHVEAPRGVLVHDYAVDKEGQVTAANLLVATQQNLSAINRTIGMSAEQYIDQPDEVLLNAVEFGIRCYDPCLSCATHRIGEMPISLVIRRDGKQIRCARRTPCPR